MNNIEEQTEKLAKAILESNEYSRYVKAKDVLVSKKELKARVDQYRQDNFNLQNNYTDNKIDEYYKLENEYRELTKDGEVKEYLDSELIFARMIKKTFETLIDQIDIDLNF